MQALNIKLPLEHLLFAVYLFLFAWCVTKIKFFTRTGLKPAQLVILFLLKVMGGIFYGWIGVYYGNMAQMVDTWDFHYLGLRYNQLLMQHPQQFFATLLHSEADISSGGFLGSDNSWWNDLDWNIMVKGLAMLNVISAGSYFTNVVFFAFISLFGPMALYRVMSDYYRGRKVEIILFTFLIPSFIYWTSGIHKDGLIFNAIAFIIYCFYFGLKGEFGLKKLSIVLFSLTVLLLLRNYLFLIIIPPLFAWLLSVKTFLKAHTVYVTVFAATVIFFFAAPHLTSKLNFPDAYAQKQQQFMQLKGNSAVPVNTLEPTLGSFITNAPQALNLSLLRPYPSDANHLLSLAAAAEIMALLLVILLFLIWHKKLLPSHPFTLFCLFFSLSILMTVGYTVNFLGAIVRYRSIVLPLIFVPLATQINWNRIGQLFFNINKDHNV